MENKHWVGVDTHKDTIALYKDGKFKEFKTTDNGYRSALIWAGKDSKWAIEGAYCFGRSFSTYLIRNGYKVYEVNPQLTKSWRKNLSISNPKNDYGDAKVISIFAKNSRLQLVSLETVKLKEKLTARNLAVKQRTEIINSIKMLFNTRGDKPPFKDFDTKKAEKWISTQEDVILKNFGEILITLNKVIKELEKEIKNRLPQKAQKLMKINGIKEITAATIYTETKGKLISSESLASYAGIAPVDNSSGKTLRHRNNKSGNRILNSVFYRLALHQSRYEPTAKAYYERKLSEGKSKRHARKCLARQLIRIVFNSLNN